MYERLRVNKAMISLAHERCSLFDNTIPVLGEFGAIGTDTPIVPQPVKGRRNAYVGFVPTERGGRSVEAIGYPIGATSPLSKDYPVPAVHWVLIGIETAAFNHVGVAFSR